MQQLQNVFSYQDKQVRTVLINGEPWFVAKDVCDVLAISNNRDALSRLDEDEKNTVALTDGNRGNPNTVIVNESGLYSLILGSRKPEAKAFKRWVTHEVLPAIRETGRYETKPLSELEILQASVNLLVEQERKLKQLAQQNAAHETRIEQLENKIEKRMTDDFGLQLVTPTQLGKMFEPALSAKAINKLLQECGLQWRVGGEWVSTVDGKKYSSSEPVQLPDGKMIYQLKWQRRVKDLLIMEKAV